MLVDGLSSQFLVLVQAKLADGGAGRVIKRFFRIEEVTSKILLNFGDELHL